MVLKIRIPADDLIADLESLIPEKMEEVKVPGLSIALIRDAKVLWSEGFGVTSVTSGDPVTNDTVFSAQSLSKPVFAYATLKMCEKDTMDLETPLTEYLPEPYITDDPHLGLITARHVLSHTCGFPNWRPKGKPLKVLFTPGERFSYSGEGYVYLGKVIEHLSGQPLEDYMKENVQEPFGMPSSSYVWNDAFEGIEAHDAEGVPTGMMKKHEADPASSLYSTPTEYARFMCEIIQPSREDAYRLSEVSIVEMLKPRVRVFFSISWGLGWGIQHSSDGESFWHWGRGYKQGGLQNFAIGFRDQRIGVVIMTNSANGLKLCEEIIIHSIGGEHPAFSDFLGI